MTPKEQQHWVKGFRRLLLAVYILWIALTIVLALIHGFNVSRSFYFFENAWASPGARLFGIVVIPLAGMYLLWFLVPFVVAGFQKAGD